MKYLSDYMNQKQTDLFEKTGTFFAFSQKQYDEKSVEGVTYVGLGAGMVAPKERANEIIKGLDKIYKDAIQEDLKDNGIEAIIKRELYNHECFYVGSIEDCVDKLEDYPCTQEDIQKVYNEEYDNACQYF